MSSLFTLDRVLGLGPCVGGGGGGGFRPPRDGRGVVSEEGVGRCKIGENEELKRRCLTPHKCEVGGPSSEVSFSSSGVGLS